MHAWLRHGARTDASASRSPNLPRLRGQFGSVTFGDEGCGGLHHGARRDEIWLDLNPSGGRDAQSDRPRRAPGGSLARVSAGVESGKAGLVSQAVAFPASYADGFSCLTRLA